MTQLYSWAIRTERDEVKLKWADTSSLSDKYRPHDQPRGGEVKIEIADIEVDNIIEEVVFIKGTITIDLFMNNRYRLIGSS